MIMVWYGECSAGGNLKPNVCVESDIVHIILYLTSVDHDLNQLNNHLPREPGMTRLSSIWIENAGEKYGNTRVWGGGFSTCFLQSRF